MYLHVYKLRVTLNSISIIRSEIEVVLHIIHHERAKFHGTVRSHEGQWHQWPARAQRSSRISQLHKDHREFLFRDQLPISFANSSLLTVASSEFSRPSFYHTL